MSLMTDIRTTLTKAMKTIRELREDEDTKTEDEYIAAIAEKKFARSIIGMIPSLNKKEGDVTDEEVIKLVQKYILVEKESLLYKEGHLTSKDVEGKTPKIVRGIIQKKMTSLGNLLENDEIRAATKFLPKVPDQKEVTEFLDTVDMSQFRNKMQAMSLVKKQFPSLPGFKASMYLRTYKPK